MKITAPFITSLFCTGLLALFAGTALGSQEQSPINPCLDCHTRETPDIVSQWETGKHSKTGVKCYVCHHAQQDNAKGMEHNGFFVITEVDIATCESCHPENAKVLLGQFAKGSGKHP